MKAAIRNLVLLAVLGAGTALAQPGETPDEVLAFGDSITRADRRFDTENRGGYPGRLQGKLRNVVSEATVFNAGRDGEVTAEGLSRIGFAMAEFPSDVVIVMEGTNDVDLVIEGSISFAAVSSNLAAMANRIAAAGREPVMATIIPRPPDAARDVRNFVTAGLSREIRDTAFRQQRPLVDVFDLFIFEESVFSRFYSPAPDDRVGHPNPAGFARMADAFFDNVTGVDTQAPSAGDFAPGYRVPMLRPGNQLELTIYDHGDGLASGTLTFTINGEPIDTDTTGGERRQTLTHRATAESLGCFGRLGFMAADQADPPNVAEKLIGEFPIDGGRIIRGDLNKSCRVDGRDLLIIALAFGARDGDRRYSRTADIDNNGIVNGRDFAEMAANFGRSSS